MTKNWEALKRFKPGTVLYHEWVDKNIRFMVVRGPGALCAYLGIPSKHPAAGLDYNDLPSEIEVHGGFTFAMDGDSKGPFEKGWYWYGWDYAHAGDYTFFTDQLPKEFHSRRNTLNEHKWTVYDAIKDSRPALKAFVQWVKKKAQIRKVEIGSAG